MTNEAANGLELTAQAMAALKPGEPITIYIREPMWPVLCLLAMLIIFVVLLVVFARNLVWWHRREQPGVGAIDRGRFCGWLAGRMGLLGLFISLCVVMYNVHHVLYSYSNTYPSAAHAAMMLSVLHTALFVFGAGFAVFLAGWLQAFVFELLWRQWELRRADAKRQA